MDTCQQDNETEAKRVNVQPHRLGMGWHFVWRNDPPIEHRERAEDGTPYYWRDEGETSEGCIMFLADRFAATLGTTAREIYRAAYRQHDDAEFDDEWTASDTLRDAWARYTVTPKRWTPASVRKLFEDLEDVNYHSFLARLIELIQQQAPRLAAGLPGWCHAAPSHTSTTPHRNTSLHPACPANQPSWHHFLQQLIQV